MPELHLEQMISSLQKEKKDVGGAIIRSLQEEAYLHPIFGTEAISSKNKNPYCCI